MVLFLLRDMMTIFFKPERGRSCCVAIVVNWFVCLGWGLVVCVWLLDSFLLVCKDFLLSCLAFVFVLCLDSLLLSLDIFLMMIG